jgi:hypothetical protein
MMTLIAKEVAVRMIWTMIKEDKDKRREIGGLGSRIRNHARRDEPCIYIQR